MGLFSFFNRKNGSANHLNGADSAQKLSETPEGVFIEKNVPESAVKDGSSSSEHGINLLFQFLEKNYEKKGYDDALMNPDNTHLEQNIAALKNELERTIRKVKTFYQDFIREINFHITSRTRSGMVDTVEELTAKKETAESHIRQVLEIEQEANESRGVAQGIILSYTRGFRNGLAAISHHSIMNRNF
jgi:hypothetical protein